MSDSTILDGGTGTRITGDDARANKTAIPPLMVRVRPELKSRVTTRW
nr:hypothetical protein [Escherichia coli]